MTYEEAMKCRQAAQLYRQVKQENERLRQELEEKSRIDLRMNAEDSEVMAIVNRRRPARPTQTTAQLARKPVFDFETAQIEQVFDPVRMIHRPKIRYFTRFVCYLIVESAVWLAHHISWLDLMAAFSISVFVFLLFNLHIIG